MLLKREQAKKAKKAARASLAAPKEEAAKAKKKARAAPLVAPIACPTCRKLTTSRRSDDAIITSLVDENPRNPKLKGFGWRAFAALLKAGGSMTYGEYRKAGGRSNDLAWDLARGRLEVTEGSST